MKVIQLEKAEVIEKSINMLGKPNLYRIILCNDGNYGNNHLSARIKQVKTMTLDQIVEAYSDPNSAFIWIEEDEENPVIKE